MKLRYVGATCITLLLSTGASAAADCMLLTDVSTGKTLHTTGDCNRRNSPASSFKVALSLMGFDSGILVDAKTPTWPYPPTYQTSMSAWKVPTDPTYWLAKSVVWYSQEMTARLGMEKFKAYVRSFQYGNQDVSGDPGKKNGLTHAWLSSSLKISPAEQAGFLRKMLTRQLPVSSHAIDLTEEIMPVTELDKGWRLHGKTGTGSVSLADGSLDRSRQFGWFIGWVEKADRRLIFVDLIEDTAKEPTPAGPRAKDEVIKMMPSLLDKL
jgi:beta-lactamase class D